MQDATITEAAETASEASTFSLENLTDMNWWTETAQSGLPFLGKAIVALLILWLGMKFARWVGKKVSKIAEKSPAVDETLANFVGSIVRYIVTAFVVIAAITQVGVETASLVYMP